MNPSLSDQQLIQRIKDGDQSAFESIYEKYSGAIYGVVLKITGEVEAAEDILQDAFVKVWTNIQDFDPGKGTFFTWILNIARNRAIDKIRSKKHTNEIRNTVSNVNFRAENYSERQNTDHIGVKEMLDKLSPDMRELMLLSYYGGFTQEEIAGKLNLPLGTVKTRMRNAIQELKKAMN